MNVLAIDTSNQVLGVAVMKNDNIAGKIMLNIKRNHSIQLMPAIHRLMEETGLTPEQLDKIIVAKGPGSYTGVRIGLSTAKTMAWTLNIPVIGVSSLELLAWNAAVSNTEICPFFDARRGLIYTGLYQWDQKDEVVNVRQEENLLLKDWLSELKKRNRSIIFLSPDLKEHQKVITETLGELAVYPPSSFQLPDPSLLFAAGKNKSEQNLHQLIPNYLRLTEAESNWLKQQQENG